MLYFSGKGCSEFPKKVLILIGILISEKSYYYWQRKFRQEAAGQVSVPSATDSVPVTFAEIPFAYRDKPSGSAPTDTVAAVQPTAVFKYKDLTVAVTNEISDTLLSRIIREVTHA